MTIKQLFCMGLITLGIAGTGACQNPAAQVSSSSGTEQSQSTSTFNKNGIAIKGTDPVAYFTESKPREGSSEYTHEWDGVTWQFSSAENRDLFTANPEKYAPQYGGYCAWAVSQGSLAPIDPNSWAIVDGKLYLNLNEKIQAKWQKDIPGFIAKADNNWPQVLNN